MEPERITEPQLADALKGMTATVEDGDEGTEGPLRHPAGIARDVFYVVFAGGRTEPAVPPVAVHDPELRAMDAIAGALAVLDGGARGRVLRWASDRFGRGNGG